MNPLVQGLFHQFKAAEELTDFTDSDAFELFASSVILPDELLAQTELTDLLLDSSAVGIDVAVLEINGQLMRDSDDVRELCNNTTKLSVSAYFIQAKQSPSISTPQILNFGDIVRKFLTAEGLDEHPRLKELSQAFQTVFAEFAGRLRGAKPTVTLSFVTTAPTASTHDVNVRDRCATVRSQIEGLGFVGDVRVDALGADDIHEAWARKNHANEVELQLEKQVNLPPMPGIDQAILGVVSVAELLKRIRNPDGSLDERVFYDNVRGFKGPDNPVNKQITATLSSDGRDLLPVLNNGVTVVADSYSPKPGDAVVISGFQVVNGCQTSHCLYMNQEALGEAISSVFVPIRLVITNDDDVATRIIRATNSQTAVQETDLVALSQFQKKLEDFYRLDQMDVKLTYERRSGQFFAKEVTKTRIVTISDQMRAVSALFLDNPHSASRYTSKLFDEVGKAIFGEDHRLLPYVASAFAAYRLENAFRTGLESKFKPARYHILTAYKYAVLKGPSAPLESVRGVAEQVVSTDTGVIPSADRLKRQPFTQELITSLVRSLS